MKQAHLLILVFFLVLGCQRDKSVPNNDDLSVNAEIVGRSSLCQNDFDKFIIEITVKNNSNKIKSFCIMSCSWDESFRTDNDDITFCKRECDSNCPVVINLEPEQSIDFFGNLSQKSEFDRNKPNSFRIGLILLDAKDLMDFDKKNNLTYKYSKCTFWSNPLKIKFNNYGYKIRT